MIFFSNVESYFTASSVFMRGSEGYVNLVQEALSRGGGRGGRG